MQVRMVDLQRQHQQLAQELESVVLETLRGGYYVMGQRHAQFESEMADLCQSKHAIGVNSGTDAIKLALRAVNIGPGDEVITTPFTFVATIEAICLLGARPVFVDIDPETFNLDPNLMEAAITPRTKAILPVDLYGQIADMKRIKEISDARGLKVIEDAAQSIGALHHDRPIGAFAHAATLSFFPTKNLGAAGDGGMVVTDDDEIADRIKSLRVHGTVGGTYYYNDIGYTSRLDEIQAAILSVKLAKLKEWNERRRYHASLYRTLLANSGIALPYVEPFNYHIYHQFTIRHPDRDGLKDWLKERGVDSAVYYPVPLHVQNAYRSLGYQPGQFKRSEEAALQVLSLPIHAQLTEDQITYAAQQILEYAPSGALV